MKGHSVFFLLSGHSVFDVKLIFFLKIITSKTVVGHNVLNFRFWRNTVHVEINCKTTFRYLSVPRRLLLLHSLRDSFGLPLATTIRIVRRQDRSFRGGTDASSRINFSDTKDRARAQCNSRSFLSPRLTPDCNCITATTAQQNAGRKGERTRKSCERHLQVLRSCTAV